MEVIEQTRIDSLYVRLCMYLHIGMYCISIHYIHIHHFLLLFLLSTPSHNTAHNRVRIKWRWNGVQQSCQYLERHVDRCVVNRLQTLTRQNDLLTGGWPDYSNIGQKLSEYLTVYEIWDFTGGGGVTMTNTVLWHVTACSVVECRRRFGRK
jgi:hypothetical protein